LKTIELNNSIEITFKKQHNKIIKLFSNARSLLQKVFCSMPKSTTKRRVTHWHSYNPFSKFKLHSCSAAKISHANSHATVKYKEYKKIFNRPVPYMALVDGKNKLYLNHKNIANAC